MSRVALISLASIALAALILGGCAPMAAAPTEAPPFEFAATEAPFVEEKGVGGGEAEAFAAPYAGVAPLPAMTAAATAAVVEGGGDESPLPVAGRMIIKNAEMRVLVADTDVAIDRLTQVVGDVGGYIISSRVWYQAYYDQNYKYASITIGVPVEQFERTLRRIRELSLRVLDENAYGEDVTEQYVDLESQLRNLEATRDRIKSFLEQAKTVDEALRINAELAQIEAQIEAVKGRMNYLSDRAAYSTITIYIEPDLPEITPTPTPTLTPTPTSTPRPWNPGQTFDGARRTLVTTYQVLIDLAIWIGVVFIPIFGPPLLIGWGLWRWAKRRSTPPAGGKPAGS